jgi:hypothetical protein
MKPFKSLQFIAIWLLRIALLAVLFRIYFSSLSTLNFTNLSFYISVIMLLCAVLVIVGGLFSKPALTVLPGLIISLISFYKLIISFNGIIDSFLIEHLIPLAISFYFFTNGNDK